MDAHHSHQETELGKLTVVVGLPAMAACHTNGKLEPRILLSASSTITNSNANCKYGPVILQFDPVFGELDPTIDGEEPIAVLLKTATGQLYPGIGKVAPSIDFLDLSIAPVAPFIPKSAVLIGELVPQGLQFAPFVGQLDPTDGSIEPRVGAKPNPSKKP